FSAMPFLYFDCLCEALPDLWGQGEHLHPWLQIALAYEARSCACSFWLWLVWSTYVVIYSRQNAQKNQKQQRTSSSHSSEAVGDGQPTCRICFGGTESGRLISPCLCSGSMRFVHLDCLNMWRSSSVNPQSAYKCDQCNFEYSFQRALYASILRSAIVLHTITMLVFVGAVWLCSYVCYYIDWFQNGDENAEVFSKDLVEHFVNISGLDDIDKEEFRRLADGLNSFTVGGINLAHIINGLMMIGLSGCVSASVFLFGRLNMADAAVFPLMLVIVVMGLCRVFHSFYHYVKHLSGKVLASAESMILEIEGQAPPGDSSQRTVA
ncbi:marchf4, partial [Symbiodinium pilosum]